MELSRPWKIESRVDPVWLSRLVAEYEASATVNDLADSHGLGRASVRALLRGAGVQMKRAGLSESQRRQAIELYATGLSIREVAVAIGGSKTTVQEFLAGSGVAMRPAVRMPRNLS